jgi:hypothetical protein
MLGLTGVVTAIDLSKNHVYSVKDLNILGENSTEVKG